MLRSTGPDLPSDAGSARVIGWTPTAQRGPWWPGEASAEPKRAIDRTVAGAARRASLRVEGVVSNGMCKRVASVGSGWLPEGAGPMTSKTDSKITYESAAVPAGMQP